MKIETSLDETCEETLVFIRAHPNAQELPALQRALHHIARQDTAIIGYHGHERRTLKLSDTVRFFTVKKEVHCELANGTTWRVKTRIKTLAHQLPPTEFIKISQSEIINRQFVERLDLSLSGTIRVLLKTGTSHDVSRRHLSTFKAAILTSSSSHSH